MLPLSEEEFREQRKARTSWSDYLAIVQKERREGEWSIHNPLAKGGKRKTGVGSRAQSTAPNSQGTRTPNNATPTDSILPKGLPTVSNQQHEVQSRMKEHKATVRKLGQVQGLQSFHPRPKTGLNFPWLPPRPPTPLPTALCPPMLFVTFHK